MEKGILKPEQESAKIKDMQFSYESSLVTKEQIDSLSAPLLPYIDTMRLIADGGSYEANESSMNLPCDEKMLKEVKDLKEKKVSPKLKYIIDIGIGGSNLGTKAIYDAKLGFYDLIQPRRFPKMIFADTNDPENLANLSKFLKEEINDPEEVLICAISKSGSTTETVANLEIIQDSLSQKFGNISERIVAITDFDSNFWKKAQEKNISALAIPKVVGGRYSVMSPVGLFPLLAAGVDIEAMRNGAKKQRDLALSKDILQNPAGLSAITLYQNYKNGMKINDNFIFSPALESMGKWYRQLMGESIGKDGKGITPTVSVGSIDLHSVGQLNLGGPKDKVTTFISYANPKENPQVPSNMLLPGLVAKLENKSASNIMDAILCGVKKAYKSKPLPFIEIVLPGQNEEAIGEFMQFKMTEMMFLGKLMGVNPFNQDNVEDYKIETKKILNAEV
jgi:glucose-6-phosphate isomerase